MESTASISIRHIRDLQIGPEDTSGDRLITYQDQEFLLEAGKMVILEEMEKAKSFRLVYATDSTPAKIIGITC